MSAKPLRINGPVEIRPLNIATISPVERIKRVSKEVKANNKGVKITPPPTPAMTATTAIKLLAKNEMTIMSIPDRSPCSPKSEPSSCISRKK